MFSNLIRSFYSLTDVELNLGSGGALIGVDSVGGVDYEVVKQAFGVEGDLQLVSISNPLPVRPTSANGIVSTVPDSASNVTLSPANSVRIGCTIFNNSSSILYVKLGDTATTSDFTVRLVQYGYYEVPYGYYGVVDGIWATDAGGTALVTELT